MGNFKNIPKTLAKRHQRYMCYQMLNPDEYLCDKVTHGRGKCNHSLVYFYNMNLLIAEKVLLSTLEESALIVSSLSTSPESQVFRFVLELFAIMCVESHYLS